MLVRVAFNELISLFERFQFVKFVEFVFIVKLVEFAEVKLLLEAFVTIAGMLET